MEEEHTELKPYSQPEIVVELELETKAGSILSPNPDPMNLPGS